MSESHPSPPESTHSGHNQFLTVPDPYGPSTSSAPSPSGSPRGIRDAIKRFRKKSVGDISLVLDIMKGEYPGEDEDSPYIHPERAASIGSIVLPKPSTSSQDPNNVGGNKKLNVRRNAIWKQISPNHISKQLHLAN
uniref:Uncharacterized protein n=1 Tax=Panagrolaimus davidi TaxID=227884 RepID=A0A914QLW9_9BILA